MISAFSLFAIAASVAAPDAQPDDAIMTFAEVQLSEFEGSEAPDHSLGQGGAFGRLLWCYTEEANYDWLSESCYDDCEEVEYLTGTLVDSFQAADSIGSHQAKFIRSVGTLVGISLLFCVMLVLAFERSTSSSFLHPSRKVLARKFRGLG